MTQALVLFSGGQDSTTCLYWAKQHFQKVVALGFDYNQKHKVELKQAEKIAKLSNVEFEIIGFKFEISHTQYDFIKVRNSILLLLASDYANKHSIQNVVAGMCGADYTNFPDCRPDFLSKIIDCANLSLQSNIKIHLPLINLNKAEVWKMGNELGILDLIINETHTDYNGDRTHFNEWGYGSLDNLASKTRAEGYLEAKKNGWI